MLVAPVLAQALEFEVASVKAVQPDGRQMSPGLDELFGFQGGPGTNSPELIAYKGVTLRMLVQRAYGVERDQVSGPPWTGELRFDVQAKLPAGTTKEQLSVMLQTLLAQRFHLRISRGSKVLESYRLVAGKNGPKLQRAAATHEERQAVLDQKFRENLERIKALKDLRGFSTLSLEEGTLTDLANTLSKRVDRPVVDGTTIEGKYTFWLEWFTYRSQPPGPAPDVFAALEEQLGLQLKEAKDTLETIVIEQAERTPEGN